MSEDGPHFSGQLRLRMPPSLHRRVAYAALAEKVSMNQFICIVLAATVGWDSGSSAKGKSQVRDSTADPWEWWRRRLA
jgi:hypothetical protein